MDRPKRREAAALALPMPRWTSRVLEAFFLDPDALARFEGEGGATIKVPRVVDVLFGNAIWLKSQWRAYESH